MNNIDNYKNIINETFSSHPALMRQQIKKHHNDAYEYLMSNYEWTNSFSEKCYCLVNDINEQPKCPNFNNCHSHLKFLSFKKGYCAHCSPKCKSSDKKVKEKISNTCINKYGSTSPLANNDIREKSKQTCLKKYGVEYAVQSDSVQEKIKTIKLERHGDPNFTNIDKQKKTNLEKYGSENFFKSEYFSSKSEQTCLEKYGETHHMKSNIVKNKIKDKIKEKYGVENPFQSNEIKQKIKQTNLEKYGATYYSQTSEFAKRIHKKYILSAEKIKDKFSNTCKSRFGVENPFQSEEIKDKIKETNLEKYGSEYYSQSSDFAHKRTKSYECENVSFDSSWELCYYLWLRDNNIEFTYPVDKSLDYEDSYGKKHKYCPDFIVNNQYVEIKGDHFIDSNGEMRLPFRYSNWSDEEYEKNNDIYKCKYRCMIENNVKILTHDDIQKYIDHVKSKYGNDFIKDCEAKIEYAGWTIDKLIDFCMNSEFPGNNKWPASHPIWNCNVANHTSPKNAWKDRNLMRKAVENLFSRMKNDTSDFKRVHMRAFENGGRELLEKVLARFTIAKIAPKVTAISPSCVEKIIIESGKDISSGVYCPMSGFGGIINGSKRWAENNNKTIDIEAYDINPILCETYGWTQRDALAQIVTTNKVCIACPPFDDEEQWIGTPNEMYKSFKDWCDLLKKHVIAKDYIFIGPERKSNNKSNLFSKTTGVSYWPEYS